MAIQAVIFDLDGTVLDNEEVWEEAYTQVMAENGVEISREWRQPNGWVHEPGVGIDTNWKKLGQGQDMEKLARFTWVKYQKLRKMLPLGLRPQVPDLVTKMKEMGWRIGLATSTPWHVVERELEELALELAFDVTTTGEEVLIPKPDPEIYTLSATKLELEPNQCLVIEDSMAGVRAAVEAGCVVVGIVSEYATEEMMKAVGASMVISSFDDLMAAIEGVA